MLSPISLFILSQEWRNSQHTSHWKSMEDSVAWLTTGYTIRKKLAHTCKIHNNKICVFCFVLFPPPPPRIRQHSKHVTPRNSFTCLVWGLVCFFFFTSFSILALGLPLQRELEFFFSNSLYHRLKMPKGNKLKPRWKESCMQLWVRSLAEKAPIVGLPNFSV